MWGSGVPGREEQGLAQGTGPGHEGKRLSKWVSPQPSVWVLKNRPPHSQLMSPHPDDLIPSRPVGRRGQGREVGVRSSPAGWGGTGKDTRPKGSGAGGTMGGRRGPAAARPRKAGRRADGPTQSTCRPGSRRRPTATARHRETPQDAGPSRAEQGSWGFSGRRTVQDGDRRPHTEKRRGETRRSPAPRTPALTPPGSEAPQL